MSNYMQACADKFALYLLNNNHLKEFKIEKKYARELYDGTFKKDHKITIGFGSIFYYIFKLLKRRKTFNIMVFNENKLLKLKKNEPKIDATFKKATAVKKQTIVDHNISFNSNKESIEEGMVSEKECKICNVLFKNEQDYKEHLRDSKHSFIDNFNKALKKPNEQLHIEFIVHNISVKNSMVLRKNESHSIQLQITNLAKQTVKILSFQRGSDQNEIEFNPNCPVELPPAANTQFHVKVCSGKEGIIYFPLLMTVESNNNKQFSSVEMVFQIHDEFYDELQPVEPYKRTSKAALTEFIEHIDSGERPSFLTKIPFKVPLKPYNLPVEVALVLNTGLQPFNSMTNSQRDQLDQIKNLLKVKDKKNCLDRNNYTKLLDLLLYIEEHQMSKDIRNYDLDNQVLKKAENGFLELQVPGLAEHRPSVIYSDPVFVRENKKSTILYEGFVHKVKESSVLLKFSQKFMNEVFVKNKKFFVHFDFNRYPLKVEHQAISFTRTDNIAHLFFPVKKPQKPGYTAEIKWFNRDIVNNIEQQQAVRAILNRTAMPYPYLIFGPPGTGKTMTVVESVRQIHNLTNHKILICTPSNNAANEVARRLSDLPTTDMFRYIAPSFPYNQIPEEINKYTNFSKGNYYQPTIEELMTYRILITTLCSAAKLVNLGCPGGHFAYVFIDESGQATETQTLIPIAHILSSDKKRGDIFGQIVLAGDPMQLGPVIHSILALDYGFGISMLERLMTNSEPYKKDSSNNKYNSSVLTKLLKNYRSHSVIIKIPNELFYGNELQTAGDHMINVALNWDHLPTRKFPLIFHSVLGIDQREGNSPSFFNVQEVQAVMNYLNKLIGCKMQGIKIEEKHIGIVSPYKKQVDKIKQACRKKHYNDNMMIGSVEQIQGQERLIIIISTVRSRPDFLQFDSKYHLGFLQNPKRFNVAVTRAKALLIIIGNPNILQYDKNWNSLISYCRENKSMVGDKFDFKRDEEIESLVQDIESKISLNGDPNSVDGPSFVRGDI